MKRNIKKILAVLVVLGTFIGYVFSQRSTSTNPIATNDISSGNNNSNSQTPITPHVSKPAGAFVDGTYTGSVANAYYGNVQVQVIIQNGALADVVFLQHPSDRNTSMRINNMAMSQLKSEAVQIQSANVNAISGASETSRAFVQSLQSALNQAKA